VKAALARKAFLCHPDHNEPFHICADASGLQLGAATMQEGKPVAHFSRESNSAQQKHATIEKESLSIMGAFEEFHDVSHSCEELHVHTDHENLTFKNLNSEHVLRWRLHSEECDPVFHHVKGETSNSFADALLRLPFEEDNNFAVKQASSPGEHNNNLRRSQSSIFEDNFMTTSLNVNKRC